MFILYFTDRLQEIPTWLVVLFFFGPLVGGLVLYFYKTRYARSWRKGIFPEKLPPTEDNILEAYLALAAKMMLLNYREKQDKIQFINQYFNRYFHFANYNFGDSLMFSLRYPIQLTSVLNWFAKHHPSQAERLNIIYFLTGLGMLSGTLNPKEVSFLSSVCRELELPETELERIIRIYAQYRKNQSEETKKNQKSNASSLENYRKILGVGPDAGIEEIKKQYKKLAKLHHPDRFAQSSEAQQKMAHEKFTEIQRAYDELMKGN